MNLLLENLDKVQQIAFLLLSALFVRQVVIFSGQNWIKTFSHTLTLMLLPIITYSITSVISGNIALSLGMVGALSIVRFRNPVKSPFELVIYFLMISSGIAAAVSVIWLVVLIGTCVSVIVAMEIANRLFQKHLEEPFYTASFTEGNALHTLEVQSTSELPHLMDRRDLVSFVASDAGRLYRFASPSKSDLLALGRELDKIGDTKRISYSAA